MFLDRFFNAIAGEIDQFLVLPVLYHFGWMEWEELSFDWALVCVYGLFAVIVTYLICMPLEYFRPLERWHSKKHVLVDMFYTIVSRVGVTPVINFLLFYQLQVWLTGVLVDHGYIPPMLETLVPPLFGHPLLTFCAYALILDFADYWRHRLSHMFHVWYTLHAVHHAQRQMSFWSDDRNHFGDDVATFLWFAAVGLAIGIPPLQFPVLLILLKFVEGFSHVNARVDFGWLGERLLVSPRFHRLHHGVLGAGRRSCNYGAVFPYWDMLFGTADFSKGYVRTGDDAAPEAMATGSYFAQQWAGVKLFLAALGRPGPSQYKPGP